MTKVIFSSIASKCIKYHVKLKNVSPSTQTKDFHTSSVCLTKRNRNGAECRNPKVRFYDTKKAKQANNYFFQTSNRMRRKARFIIPAQNLRSPSDYPITPDQTAPWKHKKWYDEYVNKWVPTYPYVDKKTFSLNSKKKRSIISTTDTIAEKFRLLLDHEDRYKFIIKPLDKAIAKNASYYAQHLTKSKYLHGMPYSVETMKVDQELFECFKEYLCNAIKLELQQKNEDNYNTDPSVRVNICDNIVSHMATFMAGLKSKSAQLTDSEMDLKPLNSMYWMRGRGVYNWTDPDVPYLFQSHDQPLYQFRSQHQLEPFTPWNDEFMLSNDVPTFDYHPADVMMEFDKFQRYDNYIAQGIRLFGGDIDPNYQEALEQEMLSELPPPTYNDCIYGHTQFHSIANKFNVKDYEENFEHCDISEEIEEHIKHHGIISGWTWTAAQAHQQGFWMDQDVDKPFTCQTVIFDGSNISFFCYQLNTVAIDPLNEENDRINICYGSDFKKLFNVHLDKDGEYEVSLNEEPLTLLFKIMLNGSQQHSAQIEDVINHNISLTAQVLDSESSAIEDQIPQHVKFLKSQKVEKLKEDVILPNEEKLSIMNKGRKVLGLR